MIQKENYTKKDNNSIRLYALKQDKFYTLYWFYDSAKPVSVFNIVITDTKDPTKSKTLVYNNSDNNNTKFFEKKIMIEDNFKEIYISGENSIKSNIFNLNNEDGESDKNKGNNINPNIKHNIQCYPDGSFTYTADCIKNSLLASADITDAMAKKIDDIKKILNTYVTYTVKFVSS